jgi:hypothetical protein
MHTKKWLASYKRRSAFYHFRLAQAREAEPDGVNVLKVNGEDFAGGKAVKIRKDCYQIKGIAKLRTRHAVRMLIIVFFITYLVVFILRGPWMIWLT